MKGKRHKPKLKAKVALTAILEQCLKPVHADLPFGQRVPRLADRGRYLASESSLYRVLHDFDNRKITIAGVMGEESGEMAVQLVDKALWRERCFLPNSRPEVLH